MNPRLIPGTIILCAQAAILGVVAFGGALCAVDAINKSTKRKERL